jgi:ATP-dependent RNA helicase DeaD
MVFCRTRSNTDFVVKNLCANDVEAIAIHGGLSQNKRTKTIQSFNDGKTHVLVCTDVAARGLHIENVSHVYNYDVPGDPKDYVHRIGRTARAGEKGKVVNLLSNADFDNFSRIMTDYREFTITKMDIPHLPKIIVKRTEERRDGGRGRGGGYGRGRSSGYNQGRRGNSYRGRTEHRSNDSGRSSGPRSYGRSNDSGERRDSSSSGSYGDRKPSGNFNKRSGSSRGQGRGGNRGSNSGRSQSRNSYY